MNNKINQNRMVALTKKISIVFATVVLTFAWNSSNAADLVGPIQLAADYNGDRQVADKHYLNKEMTISGKVFRIEQVTSPDSNVLAFVFLSTGPNLPMIRVELTKIKAAENEKVDKTHVSKHGNLHTTTSKVVVRVNSNTALEANVDITLNAQGHHNSHIESSHGNWLPVTKCGDAATFTGTCKGRQGEVVLCDAEI